MDIAAVRQKDFEAFLGKSGVIRAGEESMSLEVAEVSPLGHSKREGGGFSVLFRGPREPVIDQAIHHLWFSETMKLDVFLVPVGEETQAVLYEAIFT